MRVDADEALMVGDSLEGDVRGAQQAGMNAIWLRRGNHAGAGCQDGLRVVSDFKELEAVLDLDSRSSML